MNVLIPILQTESLAGRERRDLPGVADVTSLLGELVVDAERAEAGTVGLLSYRAMVWEEFAESAVKVGERPRATLALAGLPFGERWLVVPDPPVEYPVIAFWRVGRDDSLDVVGVDVSRLGSRFQVGPALRGIVGKGLGLLRRVPDPGACTHRTSNLACVERTCKTGECRLHRWVKNNTTMYGCVCVTR